jgi:hypothetical protein
MASQRGHTRDRAVVIFGAGASAACGTPLTNEILPKAFGDEEVKRRLSENQDRASDIARVQYCLTNHFHVPPEDAQPEDYPSLTLLLSLLDLSIERNRPFPPSKEFPSGFSREELAKARGALEYIIFGVLDHYLKDQRKQAQHDLLASEFVRNGKHGPQVISLNYDIIADTALCHLAEQRCGKTARLDYACDVRNQVYRERSPYGKLLKLHGSLNWLFCPGCQALQVAMSANGNAIADSSMLKALFEYRSLDQHYLCSKNGCVACQCVYCEAPLRPIMITPSFAKDYRNPHIQRVWYEAELLLRRADRAYIIGYSLPDDDLEVIHLLRRGLEGLEGNRITIVTAGENEAMQRRYISLFGRDIDWQPIGFLPWLAKATQSEQAAAASPA